MASVTLNLYDIFRRKQASGTGAVNLSSLTVNVMIVTGGYTPNQNTHDFRDDLGATEVSGTNYVTLGKTLANPIVSLNGAGLVAIDFDDPTAWAQSGSGFSNARRAIVFITRGGASSADELIGYSDDFGADKGNVDGDFSVALNASGLFTSAR